MLPVSSYRLLFLSAGRAQSVFQVPFVIQFATFPALPVELTAVGADVYCFSVMVANFYNVIYANVPAALVTFFVVVISALFADPYFVAVAVYRRINAIVVVPVTTPVALCVMVFETVMANKLAVYLRYCFFVVELVAMVATQVMRIQTILTYVDIVAVTVIYANNTIATFAAVIASFSGIVCAIVAI